MLVGLLVVAGLTPQVVTETLYALTQGAMREGKRPFNPTELWIATTSAGRREVERFLMEIGDNQIGRLCEDYGLPIPAFGDPHLLNLTDERGKPLEDAHDDAAFLSMGDLLTARLAEWTADPDGAIHLSLAGGRKTMGYLAGHALSLLGRSQDKLSHVLVNPPYDRIPEFFYPPPTSCTKSALLDDGTEELVDLSRAEVKLAYVPFLRMREVLPPVLRAQATTLPFSEIVERVQRSLDPPVVQIDTHELRMTCGGVPVPLTSEKYFAFYYALAKLRETGITPRAKTDEEVELYLDCYEHVLPEGREIAQKKAGERHPKILAKEEWWFASGPSGRIPIQQAQNTGPIEHRVPYFTETFSRCNEAIEAALGEHIAARYQIIAAPAGLPGAKKGEKRAKQYFLPVDLVVEFVDERPRRIR